MAKLPYMRFYTQDWLSDPMLRACDLAAQGMLINMMCIAATTEYPGYLVQGGEPIPDKLIAKLCGIRPQTFRKATATLVSVRRLMKTNTGVWYIPRMVKDAAYSRKQSENGRKGGNPSLIPLDDKSDKPRTEQNRTYTTGRKKAVEYSEGFLRFWQAYPRKRRKEDAYQHWVKDELEAKADMIVFAVNESRKTKNWETEGGRFIPGGCKYLADQQYDDVVTHLEEEGKVAPWTKARLEREAKEA